MKILHTSDWHVGKVIRGHSRADEHRAVLAEVAEVAAAEAVDLVLVGGDLFETASPVPESEEIVYRALLALADTGAEVVVIAGNHDNPRRLRAVAPLLDLGRVHLVAEPARPDEGGVLRLAPQGDEATLALVPFISQRGIVRAEELLTGTTDQRAVEYADRVRRVVGALTDSFRDDTVNLVLAHLMVAGGVLGGGERDAHTIFTYSVPATAFPATAQYVALGHLHRAQDLPAPAPVRYCGSLLQLDFGESADTKSVTVVEARPAAPASVRAVELTAGRQLTTIEGSLDELREQAGTTGDDWLRVRVDEKAAAGIGDQVREWFEHAVDVTVVARDRDDPQPDRFDRRDRTPVELFDAYLAEQELDDDRVRALFAALLDEVG